VSPVTAPPAGTVERWGFDYVLSTDLHHKLSPPPPPKAFAPSPAVIRLERPGRPPELRVVTRAPKTPGPDAIRDPGRRAQVFHTFLHHELQAAELFCWAVLAFPDTPMPFRRGLLKIFADEIRHMALYAGHLSKLGHRFGDFPVRDWFWERIPPVEGPLGFVAVLGIGFEGANLDHAPRFAERFRAVGDEEGAAIEEQVGEEEIPHVRFALHWFEKLGGSLDFAAWKDALPAPLSPLVMRGRPLDRGARTRAGFPEAFSAALEAWDPERP
jgi:uncharacterized ferritin-like protein (DUF455 family)